MNKAPLLLASLSLLGSSAYSDIIFSEYIEGSSNNKALELTNTGSATVNLADYSIELYSNGNLTVQNQESLSGSLAAGATFVIANTSAVADILNVADITSSVTFFNGNDVLLLKKNGVVVDRIGQLGNEEYFGKDVTLVRHTDIVSGDSTYDLPFDPSSGWTSYPQNTFAYLGNGSSGGDNGGSDNVADLTCANPATLISDIQGDGTASPIEGSQIVVEAIVTADFQSSDSMSGFFIQEEDSDADSNASTSEGLFVYHTNTDVNVGDKVRLYATVDEYYNLTQLNQVQEVVVCSTGNTLPTQVTASLPIDDASNWEAIEGMRVSFADALTVNEVYQLGRYGEFLVSNGRRFIPTDIAAPGVEAEAVAAANDLNALIVEDGLRAQNPETIIFPAPGLDATNTLRIGNTVNNLTGVMNYAYGAYKLIPTSAPVFNNDNPRTDAPVAIENSDLRIASFNVLNFFNGDGLGGGFPTARGAENAFELERQTAKLVAAITVMDADVIGLMEIENDGYSSESAIAELTAALNAELPIEEQYAYAAPDVDQIGDDAIAVGILYRPASVSLLGNAKILSSANSPLDDEGNPLFVDTLNRPALAQTIQHIGTGESFTVVVNHLKSKGNSNCEQRDDCDVGQGAYNLARTNAALGLSKWLATNPTGSVNQKVLLMGDLNSYSKEDPITTLLSNGFNLVKPEGGYSYVYDGETGTLDHALVTSSLLANVTNVQDWHINTDEPLALDYNTNYKSETQIQSLFAPTPFRSSDHDPVIIDFEFNQAPVAEFYVYRFFFWYIFVSDSFDPDGALDSLSWSLGNYEIHSKWFAVPRYLIHRNRIREATLTVTDTDGAQTSVTHKFR